MERGDIPSSAKCTPAITSDSTKLRQNNLAKNGGIGVCAINLDSNNER